MGLSSWWSRRDGLIGSRLPNRSTAGIWEFRSLSPTLPRSGRVVGHSENGPRTPYPGVAGSIGTVQVRPPPVDHFAHVLPVRRTAACLGVCRSELSHNGDMVTLDTLRAERREEIFRLAGQRGAHSLRVFGSVARGEANEDSDFDLLVEREPGRSLLDHAGLVQATRTRPAPLLQPHRH